MESEGLHELLDGGTGAGGIQSGMVVDGSWETGTGEWSVQWTWVRIAMCLCRLEPLL